MRDILPGFREDERYIRRQLKKGRYVGHHSEAFEKAYAPHYRIVSKSIYEKEIKPLLEREQGNLELLAKNVYKAFLLYTTGRPEIMLSGHTLVKSGKTHPERERCKYDYFPVMLDVTNEEKGSRPIYPDSPEMKTPLDKIESIEVIYGKENVLYGTKGVPCVIKIKFKRD